MPGITVSQTKDYTFTWIYLANLRIQFWIKQPCLDNTDHCKATMTRTNMDQAIAMQRIVTAQENVMAQLNATDLQIAMDPQSAMGHLAGHRHLAAWIITCKMVPRSLRRAGFRFCRRSECSFRRKHSQSGATPSWIRYRACMEYLPGYMHQHHTIILYIL